MCCKFMIKLPHALLGPMTTRRWVVVSSVASGFGFALPHDFPNHHTPTTSHCPWLFTVCRPPPFPSLSLTTMSISKGTRGSKPQKGLEHSRALRQLSGLKDAHDARNHTFHWSNVETAEFEDNMRTLWKPPKLSIRVSGLTSLLSSLLVCSSDASEWPPDYVDQVVKLCKHVLKGGKGTSNTPRASGGGGKRRGGRTPRGDKDAALSEQVLSVQLCGVLVFLFGDASEWGLCRLCLSLVHADTRPLAVRTAAANTLPLFVAAALGPTHHRGEGADLSLAALSSAVSAMMAGDDDGKPDGMLGDGSPLAGAISMVWRVAEDAFAADETEFNLALVRSVGAMMGLTCLQRDAVLVYAFVDEQLDGVVEMLEDAIDVDVRIALGYILCLVHEINTMYLDESETYELDSKTEYDMLEAVRVMHDNSSRDHSLKKNDRTKQHKIFHQIECFLRGKNYHLGSRKSAKQANRLKDSASDRGFENHAHEVEDTPHISSGDFWTHLFALADRGEYCCAQIAMEYFRTFLTASDLEGSEYHHVDSRFLFRAQRIVSSAANHF